jgi:hypothetical protein
MYMRGNVVLRISILDLDDCPYIYGIGCSELVGNITWEYVLDTLSTFYSVSSALYASSQFHEL